MRRGRGRAHHRQRANARSTQRQYRQTPSVGIAEIHRPSRAVRGNQNRPAAYSLPSCRATTTRAHRLVEARTAPLRPRPSRSRIHKGYWEKQLKGSAKNLPLPHMSHVHCRHLVAAMSEPAIPRLRVSRPRKARRVHGKVWSQKAELGFPASSWGSQRPGRILRSRPRGQHRSGERIYRSATADSEASMVDVSMEGLWSSNCETLSRFIYFALCLRELAQHCGHANIL